MPVESNKRKMELIREIILIRNEPDGRALETLKLKHLITYLGLIKKANEFLSSLKN